MLSILHNKNVTNKNHCTKKKICIFKFNDTFTFNVYEFKVRCVYIKYLKKINIYIYD